MLQRRIDLHTHSSCSDGTDTPGELVARAAEGGVCALALTDHDSLDGLDEAARVAALHGIYFVRGCELAVRDDDGELHILGLWMPPEPSPRMREALAQAKKHRRTRNLAMVEKLRALGMDISLAGVESLSGGGAVGRPHIAALMLAKGQVSSIAEAFDRYLGWQKAAFVPRILPSPEEGIALLAEEGATVILAHPLLSRSMTPERLERFLREHRHTGLEGLEAYHSAHGNGELRLCLDLADKLGMVVSGGSDYHGKTKPGIPLGIGGVRIPYSVLENLMEHRRAKGQPV